MTRSALLLSILTLVACGDDDSAADMGADPMDLGPSVDIGLERDLGEDPDLGPGEDMGPEVSCLDETDDDTAETATDLGMIDSAAGFPVDSVMGDIDPITDVDWYSFHDEDVASGDFQPRFSLAARPAGVLWELCMYYACDGDSETSLDCPGGTTAHTAGELSGCCLVSSEGAASITLEPNCLGTISEDGTAYARVSRQGGTVTCEGYELSHGDD